MYPARPPALRYPDGSFGGLAANGRTGETVQEHKDDHKSHNRLYYLGIYRIPGSSRRLFVEQIIVFYIFFGDLMQGSQNSDLISISLFDHILHGDAGIAFVGLFAKLCLCFDVELYVAQALPDVLDPFAGLVQEMGQSTAAAAAVFAFAAEGECFERAGGGPSRAERGANDLIQPFDGYHAGGNEVDAFA